MRVILGTLCPFRETGHAILRDGKCEACGATFKDTPYFSPIERELLRDLRAKYRNGQVPV